MCELVHKSRSIESIVIVTHLRGGCWYLVSELTFSTASDLTPPSLLVPSSNVSARAARDPFRPMSYNRNDITINLQCLYVITQEAIFSRSEQHSEEIYRIVFSTHFFLHKEGSWS